MANSSSTDDLAGMLEEVYGIAEPTLERVDNGDWNTIFRVHADGEWILRLSHHRKTQRQLEFELGLVAHISRSFAFVPQVRPTLEGGLFASYGGRMCSLFAFLSGDEITETPEAAFAAGRALGSLHKALLDYSDNHRFAAELSLIDFNWFSNYFYSGDVLGPSVLDSVPDHSAARDVSVIRNDVAYLRRARSDLSTWLRRQQETGSLTECIVHGDFYQRNILWDGTEVTGVIDWDETSTSWLEYELANAVWEFSFNTEKMAMEREIAQAVLDGYTETRRVPACSWSLIEHLIGVRRLIEIQMDLYELGKGGVYDLEYCAQNVRALHALDLEIG